MKTVHHVILFFFIALNSFAQEGKYKIIKKDTCRIFWTIGPADRNNYWDTTYTTNKYLEGYFKDNKKSGLWISYSPDICDENKIIVLSEIEFSIDLIEGQVKIYYPNGQVKFSGLAQSKGLRVRVQSYSEAGKNWGEKILYKSEIIEKYSNLKMIEN